MSVSYQNSSVNETWFSRYYLKWFRPDFVAKIVPEFFPQFFRVLTVPSQGKDRTAASAHQGIPHLRLLLKPGFDRRQPKIFRKDWRL
jgi:hypothetical protein